LYPFVAWTESRLRAANSARHTGRHEMTISRVEGLAIAVALIVVGRVLVALLKALVEERMIFLMDPEFWARVFGIIIIDLTLAGDNALVIALAVRTLPHR